MISSIFLNMSVASLKRSVDFFTQLGFMYSWGFEDLDGHLWDLFWMDPSYVQ